MKKLMIAAAVAAMIGGAQAVVCVKDQCGDPAAGTAYKVAISLKTTTVKSKTARASRCDEPECYYWRQQATKKINGLIWQALDDCLGCYYFEGANAAFWTNEGALDVEFAIGVGLIGNAFNSKKIEAYGALTGDEFGYLSWAGFGTMAGAVKKNLCDDDDCLMYPKSISGGIAGQVLPAEWIGICDDTCEPIAYLGCCDDMQLENTAAYGTIKITYDAATAKKVALAAANGLEVDNPATFYKIPAAAAAGIDEVVKEVVIEE